MAARTKSEAFRLLALAEPLAIFALIMAYIWSLRYTERGLWMVILALMIGSHLVRRERGAAIGFQWRNFRQCLDRYAPVLILIALLLLAGGMLCETVRPLEFRQGFWNWAIYLPWGILQQYILNGYFLNRFEAVLSPRAAPAVSAALFSSAHTPNWFLMLVTLLTGYCAARVYKRDKNLYFLGLAHATVGFLLFLVVPDSVSHHLHVGPGWFRG